MLTKKQHELKLHGSIQKHYGDFVGFIKLFSSYPTEIV